MLPQPEHTARTTKRKSWDKQQARTSLQPRFQAWPSFILYIPRRRFNYRAARGQNKELVTCQNNQALGDPSAIGGTRSATGKEGKGLPYKRQFPIQQCVWGGIPLAQKPVPNSVRQSVVLCYSGAQGSHDKNKPHDKNTARAKRCGHGAGMSAIGG